MTYGLGEKMKNMIRCVANMIRCVTNIGDNYDQMTNI